MTGAGGSGQQGNSWACRAKANGGKTVISQNHVKIGNNAGYPITTLSRKKNTSKKFRA
jgi:hypothetical protein